MDKMDRLDFGQRLFVTGFFIAFVAESLTALDAAIGFTWAIAFWGVICALAVMFVTNGLYGGSATARTIAPLWVGLQVILCAGGLIAYAATDNDERVMHMFLLPGPVLAVIKLIAYLFWAWILFLSTEVKDYLYVRAGGSIEHIVVPEAPELSPLGITVPLGADEAKEADNLIFYMNVASIALLVAGLLQVLLSLRALEFYYIDGWLPLISGLALLLLGALLMAPASALAVLKDKTADLIFVMNALSRLKDYFCQQIVLTLVLCVVVIIGLVLQFI